MKNANMIRFGEENEYCKATAPFLISLSDGQSCGNNELRLLVAMPEVEDNHEGIEDTGNDVLNCLLKEVRLVTADDENVYEIVFDSYIMYQTRNESYNSRDDYEIRKGNYFIIFEKSRLLDELSQITDCCSIEDGTYYPGEWKHYGVYTQNHIVDIISTKEPIIKKREERNSCYSYFVIKGDFEPNIITKMLSIEPEKKWRVGDKRNNGSIYDFSLWQMKRYTDYDVMVETQMEKAIEPLLTKKDVLCEIREKYDVQYTLEVVPSVHVGETTPCLAPSLEVMKFCYETGTEIDIDLYVYNEIDD